MRKLWDNITFALNVCTIPVLVVGFILGSIWWAFLKGLAFGKCTWANEEELKEMKFPWKE